MYRSADLRPLTPAHSPTDPAACGTQAYGCYPHPLNPTVPCPHTWDGRVSAEQGVPYEAGPGNCVLREGRAASRRQGCAPDPDPVPLPTHQASGFLEPRGAAGSGTPGHLHQLQPVGAGATGKVLWSGEHPAGCGQGGGRPAGLTPATPMPDWCPQSPPAPGFLSVGREEEPGGPWQRLARVQSLYACSARLWAWTSSAAWWPRTELGSLPNGTPGASSLAFSRPRLSCCPLGPSGAQVSVATEAWGHHASACSRLLIRGWEHPT